MSLINDMLRSLDARQATEAEIGGLDRNVRALPPKPQRRLHPVVLMIASALIGGGAVWLLQRPQVAPVPAAATLPAPVPAPTPVAAPVVPAVTTPPVEAAPISAPPPAAPAVAAQPAAKAPVTHTPAKAASAAPAAPPAPPMEKPAAPPMAQPMAAPTDKAAPRISKEPALSGTPAEQADVEYRRGLTAIQRGDADGASNALRAALRLSPAHVGARQALLGQLTEQQRWSDAETLALDGVGLLPQRSDWALLAARLMYERGDASAALDTLDHYAANAGRNADYQILYALLLQRAGRNAEAANCYRTALLIRPNEGRWWFGLGRALDADHRDADARDAYIKARDSGNLPPDLQQAVERRLR